MRLSVARRALAAAAAITMLAAPIASAESVSADGDAVTTGLQDTIDLGMVAPGADVPYDVYFEVACSGTNHVNAGQSIRLSPALRGVPAGAGFSVGTYMVTLPASWPVDGVACPAGLTHFAGPFHIVLTAPTTPGVDYGYFFTWSRGVTPASSNDSGLFSGSNPRINFVLDVGSPPPANTPPSLQLPADSTVEGSTTGGAPAAYTVTATDAEDATAPTPACWPTVGSLLPPGPNTVLCSATDQGGLDATGSFTVTVVDTTAPTLVGMPGDASLTTETSAATLTYTAPTATDVVDTAPSVGCSPASDSTIPVGDTTVTCTATDASGNAASATFVAHVAHVDPPAPPEPPTDPNPPVPPTDPNPPAPPAPPADGVWGKWLSPVHSSGTISVNGTRMLPLRLQLLKNGKALKSGAPIVSVATCDRGNVVRTVHLGRGWNGRWGALLWTGGLGKGCFKVVASLNGQAVASFTMDVRSHGKACVAGPARKKH